MMLLKNKMNKKIIKLSLFFILIIMIVIAFNWGQIHSGSLDVVSHNALVNKIMKDGEVSGGYQKNLLGMETYPPLTHYFAAGIGFIFGSSLLGLNIPHRFPGFYGSHAVRRARLDGVVFPANIRGRGQRIPRRDRDAGFAR